jgi:transketolase
MGKLKLLKEHAAEIRLGTIDGVCEAGCGHPGGSLSIAEILAVLYFDEMNIDPKRPGWPERDRFVLSKGHAAPSYYAALAYRGYFPVSELKKLRQIDSPLQGHPDMRKVAGVDMSTGSLGQGLSAANGMALVSKRKSRGYRVYVIVGDGEMQEGQIWEAIMASAHFKLDNLTLFVDANGLQIDGRVQDVMNNTPYESKFKAFGWNTICIDGHDIEAIRRAIADAKSVQGQPTAIICNTVKGKGVGFMEDQCCWHGTAPKGDQAQQAMEELAKTLEDLKEGL